MELPRLSALSRCAVLVSLAILSAVGSGPVAADVCTWEAFAVGNWNDSARWDCGHEPGAADTAVIGSGTITLTTSAVVAELTASGANVDGAGDLEVTSQMAWSKGTLGGTGKLTIGDMATLTIAPGGILRLNRGLENEGSTTVTGGTNGGTGVFTNLSGATLDLAGDFDFGLAVNNQGSVTKSAGASNTFIPGFDQSSGASTEVQTGTLALRVGGTIDGTVTASGTSLRLENAPFTIASTASLTVSNLLVLGDVTFNIGGASYSVDNTTIQGIATFNGPAVSMPSVGLGPFNGNTLQGSADIEVTTLMIWAGGIMGGTGKATIVQGAELSIVPGGFIRQLNRNLDNAGTITITTGFGGGTGLFTNLSTGTFDLAADIPFNNAVTNQGTLVKSAGAGTTSIGAPLSQSADGSIDVQVGTLDLQAGGTIDGTVTATGTTVRFVGGTFDLTGADIDVGALWITNSNTDLSNADSLTIGDFVQTGGTVTVDHPEVIILGTFLRNPVGSAFVPGKGRIVFAGGTEQNLTLQRATEFFYLEVSPGTTLIETESTDHATVSGFLRNRGTIRKTRDIPAGGSVSFGLTDIELNIVDAGSLTSLQVDRIYSDHPGSADPTMPDFYWQLTPTGGGATADVTLYHCYQPDTEALLCRWTGASWDCGNDFSTQMSITRTNVTQFGDWSAGATDPYDFMTAFECGNVSAWSDARGLC